MPLLYDQHLIKDEIKTALTGRGKGGHDHGPGATFISSIDVSHRIQRNTGKLVPYSLLVQLLGLMQDQRVVFLGTDGWRLVERRSRVGQR